MALPDAAAAEPGARDWALDAGAAALPGAAAAEPAARDWALDADAAALPEAAAAAGDDARAAEGAACAPSVAGVPAAAV